MTNKERIELKHELDTYGGGIGTADALKLIAEIERLQSEREWRPIETVKNGVLVLCCSMESAELKDSYCLEWFVNGKPGSGIKRAKPTHWTPLPPFAIGGKE